MKITKIDIYMLDATVQRASRRPIIARITTDEGIYGDGEAGIALGTLCGGTLLETWEGLGWFTGGLDRVKALIILGTVLRLLVTVLLVPPLENDRDMTLIAPRRYGKTGLVHNVFHRLRGRMPTV